MPAPGDLVPHDYVDWIDPDPAPELASAEWNGHLTRELRRYRDGRLRLADVGDTKHSHRREQQLMRIASAAWGAGLALLMAQQHQAAHVWLHRAATLYRRSLAEAEPGSWGRSIGSLKALLLADDIRGAERDALQTLDLGAATSPSPTARYSAILALLVIGREAEAAALTETVISDESFPRATGRALAAIACGDRASYADAVAVVLETFETRDRFLEDIPVADTVLALQALARLRHIDVTLRSIRLPAEVSRR